MDDLESARRMGREGQQALGLSVQEQGEYNKGRRERDQRLNAYSQPGDGGGGGGGGGIGALFLLALAAPAFAAPGLALWTLWNHFQSTQGWDWPVLTAICTGAAIAMLWLAMQLWRRTPVLILAITLSLYLGVSYAICMPMLFSTDVWWTAISAIGTAAAGYWAGLNAPNRWMSSFFITTVAALVLGVFLNLFALDIAFPTGAPLYVALAGKWAGAGLALAAILRIIARWKWGVLGLIALVVAGLFLAPAMLGELANAVVLPPEPTYIEIES